MAAYHYTDRSGMKGILASGKINSSLDTKKDAVKGEGVYLTEMPPSTPSEKLLQNNYDNGTINPQKVDSYVKFDKSKLDGAKHYKGDRDVIVVEGSSGLDLRSAEAVGQRRPDGSYEGRNLKTGQVTHSEAH